MTQYTLKQLTEGLNITIKGDPITIITGVATIQHANTHDITFLTNSHYRQYLSSTNASAVILKESEIVDRDTPINYIISTNPHYTYAMIARFFEVKTVKQHGCHETVIMGKHSEIHPTAYIGANCVIGDNVKIGERVVIQAGSIIGDDCTLGDDVMLNANVTLYRGVQIGKRSYLASGVVVGSQGFGFANEKGIWHKVPQLGRVIIGDDVDIGANTTIDCGALEDTIIGDGVKLDNLIQIGHNVRIGDHTIIAGCTGIAGSTEIGRHCMIGGACMINGHIHIADKVMITGGSGVSKSIREAGVYSSGPMGAIASHEHIKNHARINRLADMMERVKELEASVALLKEGSKL